MLNAVLNSRLAGRALSGGDWFLAILLRCFLGGIAATVTYSFCALTFPVDTMLLQAVISGKLDVSRERIEAVSKVQYADIDWPWGDFPKLPRTSWPASPWRAALFDGDQFYEITICKCLCCYLALHAFAILVLSPLVGEPLKQRPTIIAGTLHAFGTAAVATTLLVTPRSVGLLTPDAVALVWQRWALPWSVSYFFADFLWYCVPTGDVAIIVHHFVMIACHYPIGESNGALVAGAGDELWCVYLSLIGYTAEWTTALLNVRWWLSHTLTSHSKAGKTVFSVVSALVLASYASRLFVFPYLIIKILSRFANYVERRQILTFVVALMGHTTVLALSIQWISYIFKSGGPLQFCIFRTCKPKAPGQFDFRDELIRDEHRESKPVPCSVQGQQTRATKRRAVTQS